MDSALELVAFSRRVEDIEKHHVEKLGMFAKTIAEARPTARRKGVTTLELFHYHRLSPRNLLT